MAKIASEAVKILVLTNKPHVVHTAIIHGQDSSPCYHQRCTQRPQLAPNNHIDMAGVVSKWVKAQAQQIKWSGLEFAKSDTLQSLGPASPFD